MNLSSPATAFRIRWATASWFFVYTLLTRLIPYVLHNFGMELNPSVNHYPWNFSPALAVCLFSGAFCSSRRISFLLPPLTFLVGDLGIWALTGRLDWAFYPSQYGVYLALTGCTSLGLLLRHRCTIAHAALAGLAGCLLFYVVTNLAMWAAYDTYAHTFTGLVECYVAAIPFFRNSILGTVVFGAVLFSPVCLRQVNPVLRQQPVAEQIS